MVVRNAMKKYIQPNMYRLLRNGSRDEYRLTDRAEEIAWELHKVLSVDFEKGEFITLNSIFRFEFLDV